VDEIVDKMEYELSTNTEGYGIYSIESRRRGVMWRIKKEKEFCILEYAENQLGEMKPLFERDIVKLTPEQGTRFMTEVLPVLIRELSYMKNSLALVQAKNLAAKEMINSCREVILNALIDKHKCKFTSLDSELKF